MKNSFSLVGYIEGIYAAADAIRAGVKIQNAEEIIDAVGVFQITEKFRRGDNTATGWDVLKALDFWTGMVKRYEKTQPQNAELYRRWAGAFGRAIQASQACRG